MLNFSFFFLWRVDHRVKKLRYEEGYWSFLQLLFLSEVIIFSSLCIVSNLYWHTTLFGRLLNLLVTFLVVCKCVLTCKVLQTLLIQISVWKWVIIGLRRSSDWMVLKRSYVLFVFWKWARLVFIKIKFLSSWLFLLLVIEYGCLRV